MLEEIDWEEVKEEVTVYLQELLRIDTTNPPGNEIRAARYLEGVLSEEGFEPLVMESAPGRGNLVARLKGSGEAPPLILLSHLDVVPAEAEKWTHHPFGGELAEGYIWGRGAVDMKNLTAIEMMVLILCRRYQLPLKRDLILVATADEETGGKLGAGWLAEHHPGLLEAEYAINEGGGFPILVGGKSFYTCQVAEKGVCWMKLIARGKPGHGSIPHDDNAVLHLARVLDRLGRAEPPIHLTDTVAEFLRRIAQEQERDVASQIEDFLVGKAERLNLEELPIDPFIALMLNAMLHNTFTPTILRAGSKTNVIPSEAIATIDGRVLPGQEKAAVLGELVEAIGEEMEKRVEEFRPGLETSFATPLYEAICQVMAQHDPEGIIVPYMVTGGTDAMHLAKRGVKVYGFCPTRYDPGLSPLELAHAHDERISQENLLFGTRVIFDLVARFCQ